MAKYKLAGDMIQNKETTAFIPKDPGNIHYVEYLQWESEGNTPDPEFTLEQRRERRISELKEQASNYIEQYIPEKDQRYTLGQVTFLLDSQAPSNDVRLEAARADWTWINLVMQERDNKVSAVKTSDNPESISPAWPLYEQ